MENTNRFVNKKTILNRGTVFVNCCGTETAKSKNGVDLGCDYWISRDGVVASTRCGTFKILKIKSNKDGYKRTTFQKMANGIKESKSVAIHRLVAEIFIGDIPEGYVVDHINHIRNDNRAENLRIVTVYENNLNVNRSKSNYKKVLVFDYYTDKFIGEFEQIKYAAESLQLSVGNISTNLRKPEEKPFVTTKRCVVPQRRYYFKYA